MDREQAGVSGAAHLRMTVPITHGVGIEFVASRTRTPSLGTWDARLVSKASERPRKPPVFQLVVGLFVALNVGVIGLVRQDSRWELTVALLGLASGVGYGLAWLREYRRYREALRKTS